MIQILMATYNGAAYLKEQLDSLLAQTLQDFEIIVRDDGSTDETQSILQAFQQAHPEKIRIFKNDTPTGNAKDNFFLLMQDADADFVCFCDQDDVWLPEKLELTYQKMQELNQAKPALVHTDLKVVDKDLNIIRNSFFKMQHFDCVDKIPLNRVIAQNVVTGCTVMINRVLLDAAKNTNCDGIIMHDWWLAIIAAAFGEVRAVKTPTILYRQHGKNSVGAKSFWQSINLVRRGEKNLSAAIDYTYQQADCFISVYGQQLSPKVAMPITIFASSCNTANCCTLWNTIKNGFLKQSFIHRTAQVLLLSLTIIKRTFKKIFKSVFQK